MHSSDECTPRMSDVAAAPCVVGRCACEEIAGRECTCRPEPTRCRRPRDVARNHPVRVLINQHGQRAPGSARHPADLDPADPRIAHRLVSRFSARTGVKAKLVSLYDDFETKLQQQAAQRQLPDIVINDTAQLGTMQSQGWLQEIDRPAIKDSAKISDRAWEAAKASNGRYYAVPFSAQSFAIFVRADWRARLRLPEPKTWTDLANMATAFTERDPDGDGKADTY